MPMDFEKLKEKKARRTGTGWQPKEGDSLLRLLPHTMRYFTESLSEFAIEFRSHFMMADGTDTQVFRCFRDRGETCEFCTRYAQNKASTNERLKKSAEQIRGSTRYLMNILNLNDVQAGIQVYESGPMVYDDFFKFIANPAWGEIVHPEQGRNWTLNLTPGSKSKSGYNEYSAQPHPNPSDIMAHLPADWQEKLDLLSAAVPPYASPEEVTRWIKVLGFESVEAAVQAAAGPIPAAPVGAAPKPPAMPPLAAPVPVPPIPVAPVPPIPVAPVAPPLVPAAAPIAAPAAPPISPPVSGAVANPEMSAFIGAYPTLSAKVDAKEGVVPGCFTEDPSNMEIGFNPNKWPCNHPCPVKAKCQIKKLGL